MTKRTRLMLMLALGSCLVGSGCNNTTTQLLVDATLATCPESTVFLSGWWSSVSVEPDLDPIGGYLMIYWVDEDGNACHGTPGISGQPGPFALKAFDPDAWSASAARLPVTAAQLEDFQEIPFSVEPYVGSGLHFVQHYNTLWRIRADGTAFRSGNQFSMPAVVSMDRDSFCVSAFIATEQGCASTMSLPIPNPIPASGQHPTKCKTRSMPTEISPAAEERLASCLLRLPHGMDITE